MLKKLSTNKFFCIWLLNGILLSGCFVFIYHLSFRFELDKPLLDKPVLILVAILFLAGIVYFLNFFLIKRSIPSKYLIYWIVLVGLNLRFLMLFSTPILEDDYFRYLWDGAVVANSLNPYKYSPKEILESNEVPIKLKTLANESKQIVKNINNPEVRTIYPPVSQFFFGLSHALNEWSIKTWRLILFLSDLFTLVLLVFLFNRLKISILNSAIYFWNPILIFTIFNSCHMDVLVFPFVLGAILLAMKFRYIWSIILLCIGMGIKIWPIILIPAVFRQIILRPKQLFGVVSTLFILLALMFIPIYLSGLDDSSGFIAYGKSWENNSSIFRIILYIIANTLNAFEIHPRHGEYVSRYMAGIFILLWIAYVTFRFRNQEKSDIQIIKSSLLIIGFSYLISPTQFPWYYIWLLPFLAIVPIYSLLFLTVSLPLYYLRFYFEPREQLTIFTNLIVWIEFAPVWLLILYEWLKSNNNESIDFQEASLT